MTGDVRNFLHLTLSAFFTNLCKILFRNLVKKNRIMAVVITLKLKQVKVIEIYVTNNFSQSNCFDVIKTKIVLTMIKCHIARNLALQRLGWGWRNTKIKIKNNLCIYAYVITWHYHSYREKKREIGATVSKFSRVRGIPFHTSTPGKI